LQIVVLHVGEGREQLVIGGAGHAGEQRVVHGEPLPVRAVRPRCRQCGGRIVAAVRVLRGGRAAVGRGGDAVAGQRPQISEIVLASVVEPLVGVATAGRTRVAHQCARRRPRRERLARGGARNGGCRGSLVGGGGGIAAVDA